MGYITQAFDEFRLNPETFEVDPIQYFIALFFVGPVPEPIKELQNPAVPVSFGRYIPFDLYYGNAMSFDAMKDYVAEHMLSPRVNEATRRASQGYNCIASIFSDFKVPDEVLEEAKKEVMGAFYNINPVYVDDLQNPDWWAPQLLPARAKAEPYLPDKFEDCLAMNMGVKSEPEMLKVVVAVAQALLSVFRSMSSSEELCLEYKDGGIYYSLEERKAKQPKDLERASESMMQVLERLQPLVW